MARIGGRGRAGSGEEAMRGARAWRRRRGQAASCRAAALEGTAPHRTSLFILYRRSPMARDRLRLPLTCGAGGSSTHG